MLLGLLGLVTLTLQEMPHIVLLVCVYNKAQCTRSSLFPSPPGLKLFTDSSLVTNVTLNDFLFENIANWNANVS